MEIFNGICRCCNNERKIFKNIFEDNICNTKGINEILSVCSQMDVNLDDIYPKQICFMCVTQLEISYKFLMQYRKSIQQFDTLLLHMAKSSNAYPNIAKEDELAEENNEFNVEATENKITHDDCIDTRNYGKFVILELEDVDTSTVDNDFDESSIEDIEDIGVVETIEEEQVALKQSSNQDETLKESMNADIKGGGNKDLNFSKEQNQGVAKSSNCTKDGLRRLSCPVCDIKFFTTKAFLLHQKIKHKREKLQQNKSYSCNKSKKSLENLELAAKHIEICKNIRKYGCNVCLIKFSTREKLNLHLKEHSN